MKNVGRKNFDEKGASLPEYVLLVALIAIGAIIAITSVGGRTSDTLEDVAIAVDETNEGNLESELNNTFINTNASLYLNPNTINVALPQQIENFTNGETVNSDGRDIRFLPWEGLDYIAFDNYQNNISTPLNSALESTDFFSFRFDTNFQNTNPDTTRQLIGGSFNLVEFTTGKLGVRVIDPATGTSATTTFTGFNVSDYTRVQLRVDWNPTEVILYVKDPNFETLDSDNGWIIMDARSHSFGVLDFDEDIMIGGDNSTRATRRPIYQSIIQIGTTEVEYYPDRDNPNEGDVFTAPTGETWTINRSPLESIPSINFVDKPTALAKEDNLVDPNFFDAPLVLGEDELTILVHRERPTEFTTAWRRLISSELNISGPNNEMGLGLISGTNTDFVGARIEFPDATSVLRTIDNSYGEETVIALRVTQTSLGIWSNQQEWDDRPFDVSRIGTEYTQENLAIGSGQEGIGNRDFTEIYNVAVFENALTNAEIQDIANTWLN